MKHNLFKYTLSLGFVFMLFSSLFLAYSTVNVLAEDNRNFGLTETANVGDVKKALTKEAPEIIIGRIIGVILSLIGVVFFGLIVFAGFSWMLASGNEQKIASAKQMIVAAILGLLTVLSAYAITAYVGDVLTKN